MARKTRLRQAPDASDPTHTHPYRRRRDWGVAHHSIDRPDWEPVEGEKRYLVTLGWTIVWYALPLALYAAWTLTFDGNPATACATPVNNVCPPVRRAALDALAHGLPKIGVAVAASLLIALIIRLGSGAWRPLTAAFAAAVIGSGAATIVFSVVNA
jgi:hypothetical protein